MYRFAGDTKSASAAAGEPIIFDYQDADWSGVARPMVATGRAFTATIYDGSTNTLATVAASISTDDTGDFARVVFPGTVSDQLRTQSTLFIDLAERLHPGDDQIITATLTINRAAALTVDYSSAPVARYVQRITRLFDPILHGVDPVFQLTYAQYVSVNVGNGSDLDFSDGDNMLLATMI